MKSRRVIVLLALFFFAARALVAQTTARQAVVDTTAGTFVIDLDPAAATCQFSSSLTRKAAVARASARRTSGSDSSGAPEGSVRFRAQ